MGKKGGRNRLKSIAAPRSWDISRKGDRFVYKPTPGPYPIVASYPLGVVVRDLAAMATRSKEVKFIVKSGKVLIDGTERHTPSFPVGLFNVVSVPIEGLNFRLVPSPKGLVLAKLGAGETNKKLCRVSTKTKVRGGHIQYGLHDGRSILSDSLDVSPGDALLLEVPSQKVLGQVKLAEGVGRADSLRRQGGPDGEDSRGQGGDDLKRTNGQDIVAWRRRRNPVSPGLPGGDGPDRR